jgi:hypothetical protein
VSELVRLVVEPFDEVLRGGFGGFAQQVTRGLKILTGHTPTSLDRGKKGPGRGAFGRDL